MKFVRQTVPDLCGCRKRCQAVYVLYAYYVWMYLVHIGVYANDFPLGSNDVHTTTTTS